MFWDLIIVKLTTFIYLVYPQLTVKALHVRPESGRSPQECCLRVSLMPLRLNIDQVGCANAEILIDCYFFFFFFATLTSGFMGFLSHIWKLLIIVIHIWVSNFCLCPCWNLSCAMLVQWLAFINLETNYVAGCVLKTTSLSSAVSDHFYVFWSSGI